MRFPKTPPRGSPANRLNEERETRVRQPRVVIDDGKQNEMPPKPTKGLYRNGERIA